MELAELLAILLAESPDLSALSDEDLAAYEQQLINAFAERRPGARGEALVELGQIADAADVIRAEAAARIDAAIADDEKAAELEARLTPVAESDPEPEPAPAETTEEPAATEESEQEEAEEPEAVLVAAAAPAPVKARPRLAPLSSMKSDSPPSAQGETKVRILGDPAKEHPSRLAIAEAFIEADRYLGAARMGATVYQPVINVQGVADPARRLQFGNQAHNDQVIANMFGREALLAAGGFCGPATPYYNLAMISQAARPVHDGLNALSVAGRGLLAFNRPMSLGDFSGAITAWTNANDTGDDNSPSEKNCVTIDCPDPDTAEVQAFARCLTISNFQDRYSPEVVAQAIDLTMVNWAMASETFLLDAIKTASVQVTADAVIGAAADLNFTIGLAATSYRNSDRMLADVGLVALLPAWVLNMYVGDIARADHNYAEQLRMATADAEANLRSLGIRPVFYIDTPTGGTSQKFAAQGSGALVGYPADIQWGLFHDGAHVPLDGGPELNFGVVRDSAGNAVNTYQSFSESFEGYAFLGVKSWWITQGVCPAGAFSAPTDLFSELCGAS